MRRPAGLSAPGGRARFLKERLQVLLVELVFNVWPLPETAGLRASLSYAGELMDEGFSILVFPEGRHVRPPGIDPFRKGIGIFARDLRAGVRSFVVGDYVIAYRVDGDNVLILRVLRGSRDIEALFRD